MPWPRRKPPKASGTSMRTRSSWRNGSWNADSLSNTYIRQRGADTVNDLHQARVRFLETVHRGRQPLQRKLQQFRVLLLPDGLVGRSLSETGNALRLVRVGLGQLGDLRLEPHQQAGEF